MKCFCLFKKDRRERKVRKKETEQWTQIIRHSVIVKELCEDSVPLKTHRHWFYHYLHIYIHK